MLTFGEVVFAEKIHLSGLVVGDEHSAINVQRIDISLRSKVEHVQVSSV